MRLIESKFDFVVAGSYSDESFNEGSFSPNHCFISKGHMDDVLNIDEIIFDVGFFRPHHDVLRSGNRARTLRVAFNWSQKTDVKISLHDVLSKGSVTHDKGSVPLCFVLENMLFSSAGTSVI
ncbi:hypothetical protein NPIL_75191 [Nephila pilipes]|uniref:Uncharacterized protein n=1 Tax=Nephila pilipes TaxID=299642 RepID=A0A8X6Q9R3_NEPPI|nr:hypothetical protein NPIL_75191 [Nephila pilipes]